MTYHCVTLTHSTSLSADIDVKDRGKNVTYPSSSNCTAAGNAPSTTVSIDAEAILATGSVTNKDCTVDPVDSTATENDLKLAKRKNQAGRKTLLKQERARLAALAAEAVKLEGFESAVGTVDASNEIPTVVSIAVTTVPTVTNTVITVDTVKSMVPEVTDTIISTSPDQKIFTPSLSKTMRKKMKIAKKRSGELANLEEISDDNVKKTKMDGGNEMIKVGDIIIPTSIARSVNTSAVKDVDLNVQITAAKSMEVASNKSVITSTSSTSNDNHNIPTEISIPIITPVPVPASVAVAVPISIVKPIGVSKGVRKRLKARMKAEEVLAQNPESAEKTNLIKADLLKKAVQANQVKQKLETLTSKVSKVSNVTKYLPPNLRAATTIATKESMRNESSTTTSNHDSMGKYGPKVTGTNQYSYSNSKYSHMTPTATTHVTPNFNRQNAMTPVTSTVGYQQPTSATSWGTQRNLQQTLTQSQQQQQQPHQGLSQYSQGAQYSQHICPTAALPAACQYDYPASQSNHAYMDPQSSRHSQYTPNPTITSHYTPSMSSSAGLYQQQQQQYSQLALSAATSVAAQQYALGNSTAALATQHYIPSASLQQQQYGAQYAAPAQQAYHQLQLQNTNTTTPGTLTQNSLHLNAASYGLGTAYSYNTSSFPVNTSQNNSLNTSHYVDATSRQS